jgi:hypothetical protein
VIASRPFSWLLRAALVAAMILADGCYGWTTLPAPAPNNPPQLAGKRIRVTRTDGLRIEIAGARIVGDTLRGVDAESLDRGSQVDVAIALRDIQTLEVRHTNVAVQVTGAVLGALLVAILVTALTGGVAPGPGL